MRSLYILMVVFFLFLSNESTAQQSFTVSKGEINLSNYDHQAGAAISLNGAWCFSWKSFDVNFSKQAKRVFQNLPGDWSMSKTRFWDNQFGYGSYAISVITPQQKKVWVLHIPPILSAYRLFINDSLVHQVGRPSAGSDMIPNISSVNVPFVASGPKFWIKLEVSNYHFTTGGISQPILLGNPRAIEKAVDLSRMLSMFIIGALLMMGMYHFAVFLLWRNDHSFAYFGLICVFIALRELFTGEAKFYEIFNDIGFELSIKILFSCFPICLFAYCAYLSSVITTFSEKLSKLVKIVSLSYLVIIIAMNNLFYAKFLPVISLTYIFTSFYAIIVTYSEKSLNLKEKLLLQSGLWILNLAFLNDILYDAKIINTSYLLPLGFFLFTLLHAIMLSLRFTNAFRQSQLLSIELLQIQMINKDLEARRGTEILQAKLETQENSFAEFGRELHDNIGQVLTSIKILLSVAAKELQNVPETLKLASESIGKVIVDIRSLSRSLSTEWLNRFDFLENLRIECNRITAGSGLDISINTVLEKLPLDSEAQVMLFRVAQEALNNVVKHSEADCASISISSSPESLLLLIEDNGKGFDLTKERQKSLGISNMTYRAQLLKGTIEWRQSSLAGTAVEIIIPMSVQSDNYPQNDV